MLSRSYLRLYASCLAWAVLASGCGGLLKQDYEYEEELYIALDGSATLNLNASVAALVALRGADLNVNPRARVDRGRVRAMFEGPGVAVSRVSLSRRGGRRFVHVSVDASDVRRLQQLEPFSWSSYRFDHRSDVVEFRQIVGPARGKPVGDVGWRGDEQVAFRMHVPSRIPFHNAPTGVQRGNIVEWDQPLSERLKGTPLEMQAHMEPESILYSTLLLFGSTIVAAAMAFGGVLWWVTRKPAHR